MPSLAQIGPFLLLTTTALAAPTPQDATTTSSPPQQTCDYASSPDSCYSISPPQPVFTQGFADPSLLRDPSGTWYSFATGGNGYNIQIARSCDNLGTWEYLSQDALPGPFPDWVNTNPVTWAPDVTQLADGSWIMYYAAGIAASDGQHCVATARASSVEGPYTTDPDVLYCPLLQESDFADTILAPQDFTNTTGQGPTAGAIDPSAFVDTDGQRYVVYELDADGPQKNSSLMIQPVGDDGVTATGPHTQLIVDVANCDDGTTEAPFMTNSGGQYLLFFSSGAWTTDYTLSIATSDSVTGPFLRRDSQILGHGKPFAATTGACSGQPVAPGGATGEVGATVDERSLDERHWDRNVTERGLWDRWSASGRNVTERSVDGTSLEERQAQAPNFVNPGGASFVVDGDSVTVAFHAGPSDNRQLYVVEMAVTGEGDGVSFGMMYEVGGAAVEVDGL